jgi:hypothetical protein
VTKTTFRNKIQYEVKYSVASDNSISKNYVISGNYKC